MKTRLTPYATAIAAIAMTSALIACGGGGSGSGSGMNVAAETDENTASISEALVDIDSDVRPGVHLLGGADGFVGQQLVSAFRSASESEADIVIIDSLRMAKSVTREQVKAIVDSGKSVVFDAPQGSDVASAVTLELFGFAIDGEALMISPVPEGEEGYMLTPIDSAATHRRRAAEAASRGETVSENTVATIFGI